jgi:UDP-N-acetylmuramoyl-tripeptide--D-alanyl-D-alanine ligase
MTTEALYELFLQSRGVCTDSRAVEPGTIFFALKGENFDGNAFALKALESGAKYAVIDDKSLPADERLIVSENTLLTLQELARYHREQLGIPVLGLTGTNGKTTTKELITAVLATEYNVVSTKGNLNNHIGVPLTLLSMSSATQIGVVEMGASAPGEIAALVSIVKPDCGLITNVGKAHLLGFGSLEGVKKTKGELYDYLSHNGGTVLLNADNPALCEMIDEREPVSCVCYGVNYEKMKVHKSSPEKPFLSVGLDTGEIITTKLIGSYNADNVAAALCAGNFFNIDKAHAIKAIEQYQPSNNRSMLVRGKDNLLIVDAYNANPVSMMAALENFRDMEKGPLALVIGDMLELGKDSQNEHKIILDYIAGMGIETLLFVGKEFASAAEGNPLFAKAKFFPDSLKLREFLEQNPLSGRSVLIKGSRGTRLERVIDIL